jgi:putative transposase
LSSTGTFTLAGANYKVGGPYGFQRVLVTTDGNTITLADLEGEILIEHTQPASEVTFVGNGPPRGPRPKDPETSPKS